MLMIEKVIPETTVLGRNNVIIGEFAEACIYCLNKESDMSKITNNAYLIVKQYYSWATALSDYDIISA